MHRKILGRTSWPGTVTVGNGRQRVFMRANLVPEIARPRALVIDDNRCPRDSTMAMSAGSSFSEPMVIRRILRAEGLSAGERAGNAASNPRIAALCSVRSMNCAVSDTYRASVPDSGGAGERRRANNWCNRRRFSFIVSMACCKACRVTAVPRRVPMNWQNAATS
jgi:hypothetical protein